MPLKRVQYQEDTVAALRAYLGAARTEGPAAAFDAATADLPAAMRRPYAPLSPALADAPYVCLRLPTGGGKTLLAARAIQVAGQEFLDQQHPLVLWLVPSNTIRLQTILALNTPGNLHHDAMEDQFKGRFRALDVKDFAQLRPHDLGSRVNVVVSTLATARVDNTELRKVYAHNENLEPFFASVPPDGGPGAPRAAMLDGLDRDEKKKGRPVKFSFANLLHICRPLVIVDEAHNNTSPLSAEVMGRLNPSCVVEFTATPASNSNILYNVSAAELHAAAMIKLPIELTQHATWQEAIHNAVQERQKLAELAAAETDYIRPIVLIQAENIDKEVTWQIVRDYLLNEEAIAPERIAVATGTERELDGVDLFSRDCPLEFIVTVKALKEGWDCSFAYVFCSVATVHSKTEIEQILGRVLRLPYARRRADAALNRAYAHVSSASWPDAVTQMRDRLVSMGFDEVEAEDAIREQRRRPDPALPLRFAPADPAAGLPLFDLSVREAPDLSSLEPAETAYVTVHRHPDGATTISVDTAIPYATLRKVEQQLGSKDRAALREHLELRRRQRQREHAPVRQGKSLAVPQLYRAHQDDLALVDHDYLLDTAGWNLADFPATFTPVEFATDVESRRYEIGIENNRVTQRYLGAQMTLDLRHMEEPWTEDHLVNWLDEHLQETNRRVCHDVSQPAMRDFVRRSVRHLVNERRLTLADLQLYCFALQKSIEKKIAAHRQTACRRGFQRILALPVPELQTRPDKPFVLPPDGYQPHWYYHGSRRFNNHFYPDVGELKDEGEEYGCAVAIDQCPEVAYWVRNLDHGDSAFHLPTPYGNFFPDFVALLHDGRYLVVEYKGEHLTHNTEERAKHDIGEKWESTSNGSALFLWAVREDSAGRSVAAQLKAKLHP